MFERVPFIGRKKELDAIEALFNQQNTRKVLCILAPGGVGKTRLLEEVRRQFAQNASTFVTDVLDFDDLALHVPENVELRIAHSLGEDHFIDYLTALQTLNRLEAEGTEPLTLAKQGERVKKAFIDDFNGITAQKRIALVLDTTELLSQEKRIWNDFLGLIENARNAVFLMAGRSDHLYATLTQRIAGNVELMKLEPFTLDESKAYLQDKQDKLHITLDPELVRKLLVWAQGRPILLDLATELLAGPIPPDWLAEKETGLGDTEQIKQQKEFESRLVEHITRIRNPIDRLALVLSRVYPLDAGGIEHMLRITPEEAAELYRETSNAVYIKQLPGERIALHDEMRRMVNEHVWPFVDPTEGRRRRDSRLAMEYLKHKVTALDEQLADIKEQEARSAESIKNWFDLFLQRESTERERWVMNERLLEHTLFNDTTEGFKLFADMFDSEARLHRLSTRDMLLELASRYAGRLSPEQKIDLDRRIINQLIDRGQYESALQEALNLLHQKHLLSHQRLDVLTRLANCQKLLGSHDEAALTLEEALLLCRTEPELRKWEGTVLNSLGLIYREIGKMDEALKYYQQVYTLTNEPLAIAGALNNIGYIWGQQGKYRSALVYCQKALEIRKKFSRTHEVGASYSTLGELYRNWGKYEDALKYYNLALEVFESTNNLLWLARIYSYRGAMFRLMDKYPEARTELLRSIDCNISIEQPWAYHVLGSVYWNENDLPKALENFETSYKLAIETHDIRSQVNNIVGFAEVHYDMWKQSGKTDDKLVRKIEQHAAMLEDLVREGYKHHVGRIKRVLGDIAYEKSDYEQAFKYYQQSFIGLGSRSGGYGKRKFSDEIDSLSEKLYELAKTDPQKVIEWCGRFRTAWTAPGVKITRIDEMLTMCDVCEVEARLAAKDHDTTPL